NPIHPALPHLRIRPLGTSERRSDTRQYGREPSHRRRLGWRGTLRLAFDDASESRVNRADERIRDHRGRWPDIFEQRLELVAVTAAPGGRIEAQDPFHVAAI